MISWISERHAGLQGSAYRVDSDAPARDGGCDLLDADSEAGTNGRPPVHNPLAGAPRDDRKTCSWLGKIGVKLERSRPLCTT
jgi:hypothetical protein